MKATDQVFRCLSIDPWMQISVQRDDNYHSYYHISPASMERILRLANKRPNGYKTKLSYKDNRGLLLKLISIRTD